MKSLFGCLFIIIFGFVFIAIAFLRLFYRMLFGGNRPSGNRGSSRYDRESAGFGDGQRTGSSRGQNHAETQVRTGRYKPGEKIFDKNEGEYIDFEEV